VPTLGFCARAVIDRLQSKAPVKIVLFNVMIFISFIDLFYLSSLGNAERFRQLPQARKNILTRRWPKGRIRAWRMIGWEVGERLGPSMYRLRSPIRCFDCGTKTGS
jgi:hypothetical protein